MPLRYSCPSCQKEIIVRAQRVGDLVLCQNCGNTNPVPASARSIDMDRLEYSHEQVPHSAQPPYQPAPPVPLSFDDFMRILGDSFKMAFSKIPFLFLISALSAIPMEMYSEWMKREPLVIVAASNPIRHTMVSLGLMGFEMALAAVLGAIVIPPLCVAVMDHLLGNKPSLAVSFRDALPRVPSAIAVSVLSSLATMGLMATIVGVPFALFLIIAWNFEVQYATVDQCGPIAALKSSYRLVRGSWWRLFFSLLGVAIGALLAAAIPFVIANVVEGPMGFLFTVIGSCIMSTVMTIASFLLCFRLRVQKQNFTLAQLAELRQRLAVTG